MASNKTSPKKPLASSAPTPAQRIDKARAAAFKNEHPEQAFNHFRPQAEKVPLADLPIFTGQPLIMRSNVVHALEVMEPHLTKAVERYNEAPLRDIFELPALTMALDFAVARVPVAKLSAGEIDAMLKEGGPWRELMLSYLEVVSHPLIGLVPRERVRAIRAGKGKLDTARDFVALPGVLAEFAAALQDKHPFPADKLELLGTLGSALVQEVKPGRARPDTPKRTAEATLRDQLAYMVEERYDALEVLAALALGRRKADELLPPLRSAVAAGVAVQAEATPPAGENGAPVQPAASTAAPK